MADAYGRKRSCAHTNEHEDTHSAPTSANSRGRRVRGSADGRPRRKRCVERQGSCTRRFCRARANAYGAPVRDSLFASWLQEEATPFTGWDFSHLSGRWHEEHPPWSYEDLARESLHGARSAVDLGTGGGERLSRLADAFPARMFATEAYEANVPLARERLGPLGVTVLPYRSEDLVGGPLPFDDASLDLVLDRHESYDAREVARVLAPGGRFLTQQVDGESLADLLGLFRAMPAVPEVKLDRFVADATGAGLSIERAEQWWGNSTFSDVGAIVYYLKAIPWSVPGFSVATHAPVLRELQRRLERDEPLQFRAGRFLIVARKGGSVRPGSVLRSRR